MLISRIDHVSIAVKDFDRAKAFFETLFGAVSGAAEEDPRTRYFWNIFSLGDLSRLELIKATGPGSFLDNFLATRKEGGVHHITLETPDIKAFRARLEDLRIPYFGYSDQSDKWKELFIHPRDAFGVLIQVAQMRDPEDYLGEPVKYQGDKPWCLERTEPGFVLTFPHPGGGKVDIRLTPEEASELAEALRKP